MRGENEKIKMTCLEGQPEGEIMRRLKKDNHLIVRVPSINKIFLLHEDQTVNGATCLQGIDFKKEIAIPYTESTPEEIKDAIFSFANSIEDLDKLLQIEKTDLSSNMMAMKIDMTMNDGTPKVPFNKHIGLEIVDFCKLACDDMKGVQHGMMVEKEGGLGLMAIIVADYQVFESLKPFCDDEKYKDIAFTIPVVNASVPQKVRIPDCDVFQKIYLRYSGNWWYGILAYKLVDGKAVFQEVDWANDAWSDRMEADLVRSDIIKKLEDYGTAFNGKIKVQRYIENSNGYFYEGPINFDKLSDKTKAYLTKHNLNVNKREAVNEHLRGIGKGISIDKDTYGFITVRAGSFFAAGKRSKARAYVEALENIVENL